MTADEPDTVAVTLARMEGKIDGIVTQHGDLKKEVSTHRTQIDVLQLSMQRITMEQCAAARSLVDAERARADTARALKEADEQRVALAKEKVDAADRRWSPIQRLGLITGVVLALITIVLMLHGIYNVTGK